VGPLKQVSSKDNLTTALTLHNLREGDSKMSGDGKTEMSEVLEGASGEV